LPVAHEKFGKLVCAVRGEPFSHRDSSSLV
jgi:hypothetical protein